MTTESKIVGVRLCVWQRREMRNANGPFVLAYHPYRIEKGVVVVMAGREDDGHTKVLPGEYGTWQSALTALQATEQTTIEY
jgi:hypothetical protein